MQLLVVDQEGRELIITGAGIGFEKRRVKSG
ncbi:MAG: CAT RNA binding domain-containing protein [Dorea sp.]